jgi:hypothetical protein
VRFSIGDTIRINQEIQCLPYADFFPYKKTKVTQLLIWGPWSTPLPPAMSLEVLYYWSRQYYVFVPLAISPMPFVCQFVGIKAGLPEESVSLPMAVIG